MSMYAHYLLERTDDQIMESANGFATYRYLPDGKTVYITDIYVDPDFRKQGHASALADSICSIAKQRGCTALMGSVAPATKGATTSLKVLLGYGMSLMSSTEQFIFFKKEI